MGFFIILNADAADFNSRIGMVSTSGGNLNVRNSASSSASKVATLGNKSYITLISKSGSWWYVEFEKGKYGYCHSDYITLLPGSAVSVQTQSGSLNVRSGPGTSYAKAGSLNRGDVVLRISESGGWSRVLYHGTKTGYVSSQYLGTGTVSYREISLWLRNFKQTDSRWKDTIIANTGKTFQQIGCATTAIAMLEGHRTGKLIYPDEMVKQLNYTTSGNVYWPTHYSTVSSGDNLLAGIYRRLQQGKPILFGATNRYGAQHWVVITGYTGGNTLLAENFTIHDPGSWSRTTLQDFLTEYPNFYKYFYY